jgi:filamentous hemagglutinin
MNIGTAEGAINIVQGVIDKVDAFNKGTGFEKSAIISEAVTDVATAVAGTKGIGAGLKGVDAAAAASEASTIGKEIGILKDASVGKGNFGLGEASANTSNKLGQAWVSDGATTASDGRTLVSEDKLRQYRPPSQKASSFANTGTQSNFEWRNKPAGQWQGNGHLNISPPSTWQKFKNFLTGN